MPVSEVLLGLMGRFGYALIFLFGVGEALPLIGVVIPGHALLLASGVAASAGILDIKWVIAVAFAAGVIGDALSFWIARRWGQQIFDRYAHRLRIKPEHLAKSNAIFEKHGPWALVLVRFSFIARGLGPTLAGMSPMKWRTFWVFNVLGAAAWAVVNGLGGYFGGVAFFALEGAIGRILAYTLLAALGLVMLYRLLRRFAPGFTRADLGVLIMGIASLAVFGVVASRVEKLGAANAVDRQSWTETLAPLAPLFRAVDIAANALFLFAVALVLFGALAGRRRAWEAAFVALGVGGIAILAPAIRGVFELTLRDDFAPGAQLPFPPAGVGIAVVLAGVVTYLALEARSRWRWPIGVFAAALTLLAALSPVAGGRAYPTGALAGLALGLAWLSLAILVVEFGVKRRNAAKGKLTARDG